jgi:hypothetical protein
VTVNLSGPLRHVHRQRRRLADGFEHRLGDARHRDVDAGRQVDHLARDAVDVGRDDRLDALGVVVDVEPVAARVPVAVDRQRLVA